MKVMGEIYDDITAAGYEYFIVDTGTFKNRCSDTILESDHFSGKCGMVLDRAGSGTAGPEKNTQDRNCSIAFPCSGISDHECTA